MQTKKFREKTFPENYEMENRLVINDNKVADLSKIVSQFFSGRPIDQSLNRNLQYNEVENNPYLSKGFDLADVPKLSRQIDSTLQEVQDEIDRKQRASAVIADPAITPPKQVTGE